ncbi:leucine-rich repeat protein [uncultured Prevotella sp.]|uniref:leucine-rich repeat protein n=1 Tax=Prevotella pectinovora TaxID=1602169 RepID=UPI0035B398E3
MVYGCSLDCIKIPRSVKYIGNRSLRGLTWTDEIEIPEGVEKIGYDAFLIVCKGRAFSL